MPRRAVEAETISVSLACRKMAGLAHVLRQAFPEISFECQGFGDNQASLFIEAGCSLRRVKHLELSDLYCRSQITTKWKKVARHLNPADMLTHSLPARDLGAFLRMLGID